MNTEKILNEIKVANYEAMYDYIIKNNLTLEELVRELKKNTCIVNEFLYHYVVEKNDIELAYTIEEAIEIIEKNRLLEFKQAISNNKVESFLSTIDCRAKECLCVNIAFSEKIKLDGYLKILEDFALKDKENPELLKIMNDLTKKASITAEKLHMDEKVPYRLQ